MKWAESFWKVTIKNNKEILVSAVRPEVYGKRFINFMDKEVFVNEDEIRKATKEVGSLQEQKDHMVELSKEIEAAVGRARSK